MELMDLWKPAAALAYALLEYWLGKTDKVKAGSTVELVVNVFKSFLKAESEKPKV